MATAGPPPTAETDQGWSRGRRRITLGSRLVYNFGGSVFPKALALGSLDLIPESGGDGRGATPPGSGDGLSASEATDGTTASGGGDDGGQGGGEANRCHVLVVGSMDGRLGVFAGCGPDPILEASDLGTVSCVAVADLCADGRPVIVAVTCAALRVWCRVWPSPAPGVVGSEGGAMGSGGNGVPRPTLSNGLKSLDLTLAGWKDRCMSLIPPTKCGTVWPRRPARWRPKALATTRPALSPVDRYVVVSPVCSSTHASSYARARACTLALFLSSFARMFPPFAFISIR